MTQECPMWIFYSEHSVPKLQCRVSLQVIIGIVLGLHHVMHSNQGNQEISPPVGGCKGNLLLHIQLRQLNLLILFLHGMTKGTSV